MNDNHDVNSNQNVTDSTPNSESANRGQSLQDRASALASSAMTWLRGGEEAERARLEDGNTRVHPRMRTAQVGAVVAVAGLLGVVATTAGQNAEERGVDEAAQSVAAPNQGAPEQQQAPAPLKAQEQPKQMPASPEDSGPAKGIDVSNHNGPIDWQQVADSGQNFTFVLSTDGTDFTNPMYQEQYQGAKDAGMIAGAYHFARPDDGPAAEQANRMLEVANYEKDGQTLPPVLDLEVDPSGGGCYGMNVDQMTQWTTEFNNVVKEKTGKEPIIYANPSFWEQCMGGTDEFSDQPLWLAAYEVDQPSVPDGFPTWKFWQYTDEGSVPGISGDTDLNHFQGTLGELKKLAQAE